MSPHSRKLAREMRRDLLSIILSVLDDSNKTFAFTSDIYKSRNLFSIYGLMVHFMDKNFELRKFVLAADYFGARSHTGHTILMALNALLEDAGLDAVTVTLVILLDNASNNKKAMTHEPWG